jgi:hypothetical protein
LKSKRLMAVRVERSNRRIALCTAGSGARASLFKCLYKMLSFHPHRRLALLTYSASASEREHCLVQKAMRGSATMPVANPVVKVCSAENGTSGPLKRARVG